MDALAIHPYPENSTIPPTFAHPNTTPIGIADYTKLVGAARRRPSTARASPARRCRSSTPSTASRRRSPRRRRRCTRAPSRRRSSPSPSRRRRRTTGRRWRSSFCQPNVIGPPDLPRLRRDRRSTASSRASTTRTRRRSRACPPSSAAARDVRGGVIAKCAGLELTPKAKVAYPRMQVDRAGTAAIGVTCDIDCIDLRAARAAAAPPTTLVGRAARQSRRAHPRARSARRRSRPGATASRPPDRAGQPRPAADRRERRSSLLTR